MSNNPKSENEFLQTLMRQLAVGAITTQGLLDQAHVGELAGWLRDLKLAGIDPSEPLARAVMPLALRLTRQTITLNLEWTLTRTKRVGLDLVLGGRVVTTFAEAIYQSGRTRSDTLIVELATVPLTAQEASA